MTEATTRTTRAERLAMPLAREVVHDLAVEHGACIRPVQLRRTNLDTGDVEQILVPCGHTLASVCPSCAERARTLRAAQCREGWHLEDEPVMDPDPAAEDQRWWITTRAETQRLRDQAANDGQDTGDLDELVTELDDEITSAGMRGKVLPARPARRHRSTRRRQDTPDLPRRKVTARTVGKTYAGADGKTFRPSMFLTLTCSTYGLVRDDGTPADPASYDYTRTARDALAFAALFDRFIQNLRRFLGYDLQYFAAIEPQRRLAPHIHIAFRGTISRADLRRVLAATYHQVWWHHHHPLRQRPAAHLGRARRHLPRPGHRRSPAHLGPGPRRHRRGRRAAARGTVRRPGCARRIQGRRPLHRLPDQIPHQASRRLPPGHQRRPASARRPAGRSAAVRACSPRCANWFRYGIQPKNTRPGLAPGACKGKAHRREYLGYAGHRVLVSRKWSGKPLADHRADRKNWLLATLGQATTDPTRYTWETVAPGDPDHMEHARRLLHVLADRQHWHAA